MMKKHIITLSIIIIVTTPIIVSAQTGTSQEIEQNRFFDDFDDGDLNEYTKELNTITGFSSSISTSTAYNVSDPNSLQFYCECWDTNDRSQSFWTDYLRSDNNFSLNSNYYNISFSARAEENDDTNYAGSDTRSFIDITDNNGSYLQISLKPYANNKDGEIHITGTLPSSTSTTFVGDINTIHNYTVSVNETHLKVYLDGSLRDTVTINEHFSDPDNLQIIFSARYRGISPIFNVVTYRHNFDDVTITTQGFGKTIRLEVKKYMDHDTKEPYIVVLNDSGSESDITDSTNVTSQNTSVITVNDSNNELIATNDTSINRNVTINAEYSGITDESYVIVANASMENIDILPNTKWIKAFSGFEEASNNYGLGSEIQWIFFIIIMMVTFTHLANKWVGIGIGEILLILFWITQYISLGVFLGSMVFGILLLLTQVNQSQTVTYESRSPPENF